MLFMCHTDYIKFEMCTLKLIWGYDKRIDAETVMIYVLATK